MLMKPEKKAAAAIAAPEDIDQCVVAAEEVLRAVEMKDARALAEALKALVSMCQYEEESPG